MTTNNVIYGRFDRRYRVNTYRRAEEELKAVLSAIEESNMTPVSLETFLIDESEYRQAWVPVEE